MRRDAWDPVRMLAAERLVAAAHHDHVAGLDTHAEPRRRLVQLPRRHRIADGDVALVAPGGDVEQHAARQDAVEQRVDRAPGGAGGGEAVGERAAVVELTVPADVAERVDVGDPEPVVHEVEAVEHHVGALALGRARHVVHELQMRLRDDLARERDGAPGLHERARGRAARVGDEIYGAALVVVAPAPPVVQPLEVRLHVGLRRQLRSGHARLLAMDARVCHAREFPRAVRAPASPAQRTWDEALDLIVERMRAAGRDAVATWPGHGIFANNYGTRIHSHLLRRFSNIYGCQWWSPAIICWALGGFGLGITGLLEPNTKEDMGANANLILLWGANLASQPNTGRHLAAAKRRGARIVTVDVRETEAAAQSDETFVIRPGTDAALALAMLHVLVAEGLVDRDFVAQHTIGFERLAAHLGAHTPAWAAGITGIPAGRIVDLARRYASTRPAMIIVGGSSMHKASNGWHAARAIACLPALTGQVGIAGGGLGPRHGASLRGQVLGSIVALDRRPPGDDVPNLMPQALPAPGETRSMPWVLRALAERLGLDDFFPWKDDAELVDAMIDVPATRHATVAALAAEGGMRAMNVSHVGHPDLTFPTPSGKLELFSDLAVSRGLPGLPVYEAPADSPYPLTLRQGRTLTAFHGFYGHGQALPSLAKADPEPVLWISPAASATAPGSRSRTRGARCRRARTSRRRFRLAPCGCATARRG